jgi:hypothetical protein
MSKKKKTRVLEFNEDDLFLLDRLDKMWPDTGQLFERIMQYSDEFPSGSFGPMFYIYAKRVNKETLLQTLEHLMLESQENE